MFTVEQIAAAHGKVKSGADFPAYFKELKELGVTRYETFLADGHSRYLGPNNFEVSNAPKYAINPISADVKSEQFKTDLARHQQGKSTFSEFIGQAAASGVEKWAVCMTENTCTYYGRSGEKILEETIPAK